ncbi:MAG: hypothetical protein A3J30_04690 [Candidatus Wildermuthbacteria bacterium RIFCSPLOWO2_02_FULL_47_9c]|uniref:Trypsin-like serine protease n=2 Tax=Parcubacteria group TaxID=1794811 RepID=A0A837IQQ8_9BACT|nr:MAG: hypothetical protein UY25_C0004G0124 [Candidatus Yanofskybacteria bacterium GW2011_GWC1_48_11]KKW04443.1 MAG: hypothetical protein UY38_C0001G0010 [Parcubacteria group bacterium GW2011_GWB1_49_12]KKW08627.1 MAG: hypothetical protein UY45_C0005G0030 [Parcubacteria group bacterium GW2011_GWA1_49_26]KKW13684.1 MAG: hypothetical protein UY53_C0009G0020 [Parcubacteria group bacterium GW2011_GWA2_50_10]OHA61603.1 MAG: hypothetical protein A2109_03695 [Candidatus Wildermuthbacteria bacterium G
MFFQRKAVLVALVVVVVLILGVVSRAGLTLRDKFQELRQQNLELRQELSSLSDTVVSRDEGQDRATAALWRQTETRLTNAENVLRGEILELRKENLHLEQENQKPKADLALLALDLQRAVASQDAGLEQMARNSNQRDDNLERRMSVLAKRMDGFGEENAENLREVRGEMQRTQENLGETNRRLGALTQQILEGASDLYAKTVPSVVTVFGAGTMGAGFLYGAERRYIITVYHAAAGDVSVRTLEGQVVRGKVVLENQDQDFALVWLERPLEAEPLLLAEPSDLRRGQDILVIGHPLGYERSISKGIISGLSRNNLSLDPWAFCRRCTNLLQLDAPINSGNSGGPVLTLDGKVAGIASWKTAEGLGFAVSSATIQKILSTASIP